MQIAVFLGSYRDRCAASGSYGLLISASGVLFIFFETTEATKFFYTEDTERALWPLCFSSFACFVVK